MSNIVRALLWAAAMLFIVWAGRAGWIDNDLSRGLMIAMPAMAVLTLRRGCRGSCAVRA